VFPRDGSLHDALRDIPSIRSNGVRIEFNGQHRLKAGALHAGAKKPRATKKIDEGWGHVSLGNLPKFIFIEMKGELGGLVSELLNRAWLWQQWSRGSHADRLRFGGADGFRKRLTKPGPQTISARSFLNSTVTWLKARVQFCCRSKTISRSSSSSSDRAIPYWQG
jgi:hypothetical protein